MGGGVEKKQRHFPHAAWIDLAALTADEIGRQGPLHPRGQQVSPGDLVGLEGQQLAQLTLCQRGPRQQSIHHLLQPGEVRIVPGRVRPDRIEQQIEALVVGAGRDDEVLDLLIVTGVTVRIESPVPARHKREHLLPALRITHYLHVVHSFCERFYDGAFRPDQSQQHLVLVCSVFHEAHPPSAPALTAR